VPKKEKMVLIKCKPLGFTLIELIIVVLIIMLGAGLVGPLSLKELNKSRAKVEYLELRNTLKIMTTQAYARGFGYQVVLAEKTMTIKSSKGEKAYNYEYITLPKLSFFINSNGFPSVNSLTIIVSKKNKQVMSMTDMLGVTRDVIDAVHN
jgi:prepilin-type N-terminal cleavage/methylation domain-containing protein